MKTLQWCCWYWHWYWWQWHWEWRYWHFTDGLDPGTEGTCTVSIGVVTDSACNSTWNLKWWRSHIFSLFQPTDSVHPLDGPSEKDSGSNQFFVCQGQHGSEVDRANVQFCWSVQKSLKPPLLLLSTKSRNPYNVKLFLAVQNSSIGDLVRLLLGPLGTTNNKSLHNTTEWP